MNINYVNLHHHSHWSVMDGISKYQDYCDFINKNGMYPSFAMTEHGYLGSTLDYLDVCKNNGIKPIVGCEIYVTTDGMWQDYITNKNLPKRFHLVLLCKNLDGYKDLVGMNNEAIKRGQVHISRIKRWYVLITPDLLEKWNHGN
jgi:DNA polymerase-3 subunit alpha